MKLPGGEDAIVDPEKLTGYCLNPEHPRGKHKARVVATALGFIMGLGEIIGGVAGPTLAGIAADAFGPATPMWMAAVLGFAAALFCLKLDETAPRVVVKTNPVGVSSPA